MESHAFAALREFYKSGEIVVNAECRAGDDSGWSIFQRPLSYNQHLLHTLHRLQIRVQPYNTGKDGFAHSQLSPNAFEEAYPFVNMLYVNGASQLSDFDWWTWPDLGLRKWSYNKNTRAFEVKADLVSFTDSSVYLKNYLATLMHEGFIQVMNFQIEKTRFTSPIFQQATCLIFVNKEAL